jgi:hypothetical protein
MRSLIVSFILTLFTTNVFANNLEFGRYTCTVKTTKLILLEDGVAKEYTGYEDGIAIGDKLIFQIETYPDDPSKKGIKFALRDAKDDSILEFGFIWNAVVNRDVGIGSMDAIGDIDDPYQLENRIKEDFMFFGFRRLSLYRYFRTDYSLMWVQLPDKYSQRTQVVTADCRANTHAFPAIFDYVDE